MEAAKWGKIECLETLLEFGASLDVADEAGLTAVIWAASTGEETTFGALVRAGADLTRGDGDGQTAAQWCALRGELAQLKLALDAGGTLLPAGEDDEGLSDAVRRACAGEPEVLESWMGGTAEGSDEAGPRFGGERAVDADDQLRVSIWRAIRGAY